MSTKESKRKQKRGIKYWFYVFTSGGTLCYETGAPTKDKCIQNLLNETSHMPYGTWENFKKRGYTIERLQKI